MRWDESPGQGENFWDWYLHAKPQFFSSPEQAATMFVQHWRQWPKKHEG
jgi:hypothetical protein